MAITWVMLFHSYLIDGLGDSLAGVDRYGWMGVDLFFVLSGYLIGGQVLKPLAAGGAPDLAAFYHRRVFRVVPAFLVVLALYAAWPAWRETPLMQPWWQFPTFTFNLLFDVPDRYSFSHAWSLCVEEHFYLAFPFIAMVFVRHGTARRFALACALVVCGGMLLRGWLWLHFVQPPLLDPDGNAGPAYLRYLYYPTWSRLDGLLGGVALAACAAYRPELMSHLQRHGGKVLGGGLILFALSCLVFADRLGFWANVAGYPLLSFSMVAIVASATGGTSWLARKTLPGAGWIAGISYSLYLSHKGMFHLTHEALGTRLAGHGPARFAVFAAATLAGGAVLHYAVERPFLTWRRAATRKRGVALAARDAA